MNEDNEYMLFICVIFLGILLAVLTVRVTDRLDSLENKIVQLEGEGIEITPENTIEIPGRHTQTDAHTVTDATPTEPEKISKSIRPEFMTSESVQEASGQPIEVVDEEIVIEEPKSVSEASEGAYLGYYELTAYEWTGNPCANGNYPSCGYTVACNSLALGTRIYIEGYGEYVVEDRGGMAGNVIDIYMGDYDSCIQFGRRSANVYLIE